MWRRTLPSASDMAEHRPFPPSARRVALARQAGLHGASPLVAGAIACGAIILAIAGIGAAAAARLGAWIAAACRAGDGTASGETSGALRAAGVTDAILELSLPLLAAAALAVIAVHFAQVRTLWFPRRKLPRAPALDRGANVRTRHAAFELATAAAIGVVAFGWLWTFAPRLGALPSISLVGAKGVGVAGGALVVSALVAFAIAWIVAGAIDSIRKHVELAQAMHMTATEKREDDRLAGADPRWAKRRREIASSREGIAEAAVIVLGDDHAIAIAWDPIRRPVPTRIASGRGPRVAQLLALARQYGVPVHRDPVMAASLAGTGRVPESWWPRLAELVAAVRGRR